MITGPTARSIGESGDFSSCLIYYPPGIRQPNHTHTEAQLSFLLSGCFEEESGGKSMQPVGRSVGLMPNGESHSVRFGQEGALMLSISFNNDPDIPNSRRVWRRMDASLSRNVSLIGQGDTENLAELCNDLLAGFADTGSSNSRSWQQAPEWLRKAVTHILDNPEVRIGELAAEAGVHRVYFSRMFQRFTGISPTEFRLARKCSTAMRLTLTGNGNIAQAAIEAGFADQAHWNRTCRALAGIPPGRIRQLLTN